LCLHNGVSFSGIQLNFYLALRLMRKTEYKTQKLDGTVAVHNGLCVTVHVQLFANKQKFPYVCKNKRNFVVIMELTFRKSTNCGLKVKN
jgi:hypothetical protein